jgi:alpha-beta hydrolase superfamily lysophospholipase
VPFLLALPRQQPRGVVLLLHSLSSGARVILGSLAGALAERGLASIALDMPGHGERPAGPAPFLEPADPASFALHAAQARREILALLAVLRHCPAALGLPAAVAVERVGMVGYSVGATLGLLVLAADPNISPVVLTAPAADVFLWQRLLVARHVGLLRRVCLGAASGSTCTDDAACGAGVPCDHHPGIWLFSPAVAPAYRRLIADVEPLAGAALLRPPYDGRPLLVQGANDDTIVFSAITRRVGDALGLPEVGAGEELPPRARRMWAGGHDFLDQAPVRAEAADFLARYWDAPLR